MELQAVVVSKLCVLPVTRGTNPSSRSEAELKLTPHLSPAVCGRLAD